MVDTESIKSIIPAVDTFLMVLPPMCKPEEDIRIKALVNTPALDWQQRPGPNGSRSSYVWQQKTPRNVYVLQQKTPPPGYACHRCNLPGHYIQDCPTNGDPDYDLKRVKPPTVISRSMYRVATDGSHALPTDDGAVSKPNKAISDEDSKWDDLGDEIYASLNVLPVQSSNFMPKVPQTNSNSDEDSKIKALVDAPALDCGMPVVDTYAVKHAADELDDFCDELYDIPDILPVPSSKLIQEVLPTMNKTYKDNKIKARVDTSTLGLQRQETDDFGLNGHFRGGIGGLSSGLQQNTLPPGYVCHRCNVPGHLIKHCPTNGDPNYDIKRVRPPTGIPRSMLIAASDGSYVLPTGTLAVVKPDEATFEKEMEGIPSTLCLSGPEIPSSTTSDEFKREQKMPPDNEEETNVQEALSAPEKKLEDVRASRVDHDDDVSKAVHGSVIMKEPASQDRAQLVKEEAHQKLAPTETGKKKKKAHLPTNEFEWKTAQGGYGAENYNMMGNYNPYSNGMEGFAAPLAYELGGMQMQMMNNNYGLDVMMMMPFGNVMPQFPFGINNYMLPVIPPPRDITRDREFDRKVNSGAEVSSIKMKSKPVQTNIPPSSISTMHRHDYPEQLSLDQSSSKAQPSRPSKRKSYHYSDNDRNCDHDQDYGYIDHERRRRRRQSESSTSPARKPTSATTKAAATTERKHKDDDFSDRNVPTEWEVITKKRKLTTSCLTEPDRKLETPTTHHKAVPVTSGGGGRKGTMDSRSSDDERHYKRRLPKADWEEERRHKHKHRYY